MKMFVQGAGRSRDSKIDGQNLKHARNDSSVLAADPAKEELANSCHLLGIGGLDVGHGYTSGA
jgi:hypothetical protein